jgi:hypothetical protein
MALSSISTLPCYLCYFQFLLAFLKASYVGESATSMNELARTTCVKIQQPQTRVSGAVGEFIEDDSRQRKRCHLYGTVLHATSHNRYMVSLDATPTPIVLEVAWNSLRVEHATAALPPDIPDPSVANVPVHLQEIAQEVIKEKLHVSFFFSHKTTLFLSWCTKLAELCHDCHMPWDILMDLAICAPEI